MHKNIFWLDPKTIDDRIDSSVYIEQIKIGLFELLKKEDNNISIKTLDDICENIADGPFGSAILERDYVDQGVPFIRVQNVTEYGLDSSNMTYINIEANNRIKRSECKSGDLVFTKTGRLGSTCVLTDEYKTYNIRGDLAKLVLKKNIDSHYLMSYLNSNIGSKISNSYSSGSTRGRILLSNIRKIYVPIPSPEIQKYIGDKVRKAEELREEAKRLKKDAEETLDKSILNIVYENKEISTGRWIDNKKIDDRIDADFYGAKYRILDDIEQNLKCIEMIEVINDKFTGNTPDKLCDSNNGVPLLLVKNIKENSIDIDNVERRIRYDDKLKKTETGNILITRVGSVGITVVVEEYDKGLFISDNIISLNVSEVIPKRYIAFYLNSKYGKLMVERWNKGAVQMVINYQSINKFNIPVLDNSDMYYIDRCIAEWNRKIKLSKQLIQEAKKDVEDFIQGNFDISKLNQS